MATPDYYVCDICGQKVPKELRMTIFKERIMGPAGSCENEYEIMDLCYGHMHTLLWYISKDKTGNNEIILNNLSRLKRDCKKNV